MPVDRIQLANEQVEALLRLIEEDGATPPGEAPPDHVGAIRGVEQLGEAEAVADAHAQSNAPPDVGGSR